MAEGDTILRAARRIGEALEGERVEVSAPNPRGRAARLESLDDRTLDRIETRGKHLLLVFGDLVLHSHLGMSGSWHVYARGDTWRKPPRAAWVVLRGKRAEAVQFGGPTLRVLRGGVVRLDPVLPRLGPDILAPEFDAAAVVDSLLSAPDRSVGEALLDQALVAGIGNIFKSEACFAARQDPWQPMAQVSAGQLRRVVQAARELMLDAVEHDRHHRAVYRRAGRPCPRCATPIAARGQGDASRITYWCPVCQAIDPRARLPSSSGG